jgi:hypothetical protein
MALWAFMQVGGLLLFFVAVAMAAAVIIGGMLYNLVVSRIGMSWPTSVGLGTVCGVATMYIFPLSRGVEPLLYGAAAGVLGGVAFHLFVSSRTRMHVDATRSE